MNRSLEKQDKTLGTQSNSHSIQIWDKPFGAVRSPSVIDNWGRQKWRVWWGETVRQWAEVQGSIFVFQQSGLKYTNCDWISPMEVKKNYAYFDFFFFLPWVTVLSELNMPVLYSPNLHKKLPFVFQLTWASSEKSTPALMGMSVILHFYNASPHLFELIQARQWGTLYWPLCSSLPSLLRLWPSKIIK